MCQNEGVKGGIFPKIITLELKPTHYAELMPADPTAGICLVE